MNWAIYLARGVSIPEEMGRSIEGPDQSRVEKVLKYVVELFRQDGASPFSSKMAVGFLQVKLADSPEKMSRVMSYLLYRLNGKSPSPPHPLQRGCPNVLLGLRAQPFWDTSSFSWIAQLEAAYPLILQEFLDLREKGPHFQPYRAPVSNGSSSETLGAAVDSLGQLATDQGHWNVCYLYLHDMQCFESNREACPETTRAIQSIPRQYNHALFSALAPDTHVSEHFGPTNKKLRCHLPLVVPSHPHSDTPHSDLPPLCTLTVAGEERPLQAGKCVLFDDSFLHEAVNRAGAYEPADPTSGPRVVLIVDVWHPDLSDEEIKFLEFLEKAKMKAVRKFAEEERQVGGAGAESGVDDEVTVDTGGGSASPGSSFFSVIERARGTSVEEDNIWTVP